MQLKLVRKIPRRAAPRLPKRRPEARTTSCTPGQRVIDPPVVRSSASLTRVIELLGVPSTYLMPDCQPARSCSSWAWKIRIPATLGWQNASASACS